MSTHFVWLDVQDRPILVEAKAYTFLVIQNPHLNKIMRIWQGDLVLNAEVNQVNSNLVDDLVYHPGGAVDALLALTWAAGLTASTVVLFGAARNHVRNVKNLTEAGAKSALPLAVAQGLTEVASSTGAKINNLVDVWHYLKDRDMFPEEGYYAIEENKSPVLLAKGKINRSHLKDHRPSR